MPRVNMQTLPTGYQNFTWDKKCDAVRGKDSALFFFKTAGMVVGLFWRKGKRNGSFGTDRKTERAQWSCMFGHDWRYLFNYTWNCLWQRNCPWRRQSCTVVKACNKEIQWEMQQTVCPKTQRHLKGKRFCCLRNRYETKQDGCPAYKINRNKKPPIAA